MNKKIMYRTAFGFGLAGALLLFWANGAVGIIGSENQDANLLYGGVFLVGLFGSTLSRFRPRGMAYTLGVATIVQLLVPIVALIVWPELSWGGLGMKGVFIFNAFFALLFTISGILFWHLK